MILSQVHTCLAENRGKKKAQANYLLGHINMAGACLKYLLGIGFSTVSTIEIEVFFFSGF